jgi:hypothetical protein
MSLKNLVKISNKLDSLGLSKEADYLDQVINKLAQHSVLICEVHGEPFIETEDDAYCEMCRAEKL